MTTDVLDEFEQDAISEIANLGVSRAANSLRQMTGEQVLLTVPVVRVVTRENAAKLIEGDTASRLVAFNRRSMVRFPELRFLIFPEPQSLELVRAVVGSEKSLSDIMELEHEALGEIGNIILNSCIGAIANILRRKMSVSLPKVIRGDAPTLFAVSECPPDSVVLFLYINFTLSQREVRGFIALLTDLPALSIFKGIVRDYAASVGGSSA